MNGKSYMYIFFSFRIEKEKDVMKRDTDDARSATDGLARDKVLYKII